MRIAHKATLATILGATMLLAGCSSAEPASDAEDATPDAVETQVLEVAAVTSPMTDVVEAAAESIEDGYEIKLVEVSDYITSNTILNDGDVFANFSQHVPYMEEFNAANDGTLTGIQPIYNFTIAFYSKTLENVEDLADGATVAIPDDSSNTGRALKMLDEAGIITLDAAVDPYEATVKDIAENPKNLEFLQVAIAQLNTAYEEADLVFQWPSHIAALGLNPKDDGLLTELDDRFALNLVVQEKDADTPAAEALKKAFTSDAVREVIESNGTIEVAF